VDAYEARKRHCRRNESLYRFAFSPSRRQNARGLATMGATMTAGKPPYEKPTLSEGALRPDGVHLRLCNLTTTMTDTVELGSMSDLVHVLLVDDSIDDADLVVRALRRLGGGVIAHRVDDADSMKTALESQSWDVVICDWTMPRFSGLAAHKLLKTVQEHVPFIISSGTCTEEMAIKAMQSGARDWVPKDSLRRLAPAVSRELKKEQERKRAAEALRSVENQLRQAQKMDAIGGLAAGVAHDFNNILSVITGHTELVLADLSTSDPNHESLSEIREAARRAAEMTRRLLAFGRHQAFHPQVVDLEQIVSGLEKMLRRLIGEDVELVTSRATGLGKVVVDRGQMEQVVLNLVVNARDAMPQGGTLTVEMSNVELDPSQAARHPGLKTGAHVLLSVSDTGSGMDEETKARIFEPFFTTKGPGQGTGLGLSTVYGIVKQSEGIVEVKSAPGAGTTFRIYLPMSSATDVATRSIPKNVPTASSLGGSQTILLVEDDEPVRSLVRTVLERNGYHVLVASDGDEALSLASRHREPIHLLLTDVVMPRMNGRELSDALALLRPGLRTVYMSGYTRGVLEPGSTFLQKPIVPVALLEMLSDVLGRPRMEEAQVR
jgi:two-component system cell cycle sensor histidine kinase/response regulator CckA